MKPTKATSGGQAYLELQNRARREKRPTQELQTLYVLARLAGSPHAGSFVLKGGVLLAVFDARRPTADADLPARNLANDEGTVVRRVAEVPQVELASQRPDVAQYRSSAIRSKACWPRRRVRPSLWGGPTPGCVTTWTSTP